MAHALASFDGFHSTKEVSKAELYQVCWELEKRFHSTKEVSKGHDVQRRRVSVLRFHSTKEVSKGGPR